MPGMAIEAAREGWRLTTRTESFQQDARELLPVYSNETCRGFCPGFFCPFSGLSDKNCHLLPDERSYWPAQWFCETVHIMLINNAYSVLRSPQAEIGMDVAW